MVMVLAAQAAVTPAGNPVGVPIPVAAPEVIWVTADKAVLIHKAGVAEAAVTALAVATATVLEQVSPCLAKLPVSVPAAAGVPLRFR